MAEIHRFIRAELHSWYAHNKRDLPWRETSDPYFIWLSEIILQQTRVEQGLPYYLNFIRRFPKVTDLANAPEDDVLKLWQGLGYYSRARNLQFAARQIVDDMNGIFPNSYEALLKLKGVGSYSAAAISSIAFDEQRAVVDGNVIRVIARIYGIQEAVNSSSTLRKIQALADDILHPEQPGVHNQSIMDFGALQCVPKNPDCIRCPFQSICSAFHNQQVDQIPMKKKALKKRNRYFHFLIVSDKTQVVIEKRNPKDIWAGLHQFPMIETDTNSELPLAEIGAFLEQPNLQLSKVRSQPKHALSHQNIYARFYHCEVEKLIETQGFKISRNDLHKYALPRLIDRYLEAHEIL